MFPLPLTLTTTVASGDFRTRLHGDYGDEGFVQGQSADLDGDGQPDLRGDPHARRRVGHRRRVDQDENTCRHGAIVDLDGDGHADLTVTAPQSSYFSTIPGLVGVFPAAEPGSYVVDDAPIVLRSGNTELDLFGFALDAGDLDGDGLTDLVIGAPYDGRTAVDAGSVTIVFGASL
jgi:hypothetical protein